MLQQFISAKFQVALDLDGNPATSVAMSSKASTPSEISGKFDQISYGKGEDCAEEPWVFFQNGLRDPQEHA